MLCSVDIRLWLHSPPSAAGEFNLTGTYDAEEAINLNVAVRYEGAFKWTATVDSNHLGDICRFNLYFVR